MDSVCPNRSHGVVSHKSKWSATEDEQLRKAIHDFGLSSWQRIGQAVSTRSGKQCRERWLGQLAPTVSKDEWQPEEDSLLLRAHVSAGNRWTRIAAQLPGRSPLNVKNRWSWLMRHSVGEDRLVAPLPFRPVPVPDVFERRNPPARVLEPIGFEAGLFGARFQQFQAQMFMN
jgi:hypothetical protein